MPCSATQRGSGRVKEWEKAVKVHDQTTDTQADADDGGKSPQHVVGAWSIAGKDGCTGRWKDSGSPREHSQTQNPTHLALAVLVVIERDVGHIHNN